MWQAHGGRDRCAVELGFSLLTNDTRSLGQGPLAALAFEDAGGDALALNVNSTTQPAAEQAGFAPHDLVSWVAEVSNVAGPRETFLTHVASTWGPGPLRGGTRV